MVMATSATMGFKATDANMTTNAGYQHHHADQSAIIMTTNGTMATNTTMATNAGHQHHHGQCRATMAIMEQW